MDVPLLGALATAGMFIESLPSNGHKRHSMVIFSHLIIYIFIKIKFSYILRFTSITPDNINHRFLKENTARLFSQINPQLQTEHPENVGLWIV
jgi:hypothetical protein